MITFSEYMKSKKGNTITVEMFPSMKENRAALLSKDEIIELAKEEAKKHNVKLKIVKQGEYCAYYDINGNFEGGRREFMMFATGTVANLKKMFGGKRAICYDNDRGSYIEVFTMNGTDFAGYYVVKDWYKA